MKTNSEFEIVSIEEFRRACASLLPDLTDGEVESAYEQLKLPLRATSGSAGYDLYSPFDVTLKQGEAYTFPTGIRCKMDDGWVLVICPRSGMGFKSGVHLANTVGIIDQDYYFSDNEGHIMVKLVNDSSLSRELKIKRGSAICQGILLPFGVTKNDAAEAKRNGGFGSTGE